MNTESRATNPRRRFRCTGCGLRIEGRVNVRGQVYSSSGVTDMTFPEAACLCWSCLPALVSP